MIGSDRRERGRERERGRGREKPSAGHPKRTARSPAAYSRSAAAQCDQRDCLRKIAKSALRFGVPTNIMGNLTTKWRHVECCVGYKAAVYEQAGGGKKMVEERTSRSAAVLSSKSSCSRPLSTWLSNK